MTIFYFIKKVLILQTLKDIFRLTNLVIYFLTFSTTFYLFILIFLFYLISSFLNIYFNISIFTLTMFSLIIPNLSSIMHKFSFLEKEKEKMQNSEQLPTWTTCKGFSALIFPHILWRPLLKGRKSFNCISFASTIAG